jgi:hypothetical protein
MSALPAETPPHEHIWHLRSVDFDSDRQIRELVCEDCGEVSFE